MTATKETEPWAELLQRGHEDERLVHDDTVAQRPGRTLAIPDELSWPVIEALGRVGIERLYEHQAEALRQAFDGPTIVTTGTASGKSLCFQLPTLEVLTTIGPRAPCTSTRPRRWPRIRRARCIASG